MSLYSEETDGIVVEVQPNYVEEKSSPGNSEFLFSYKVKITNNSSEVVQLISRHWIIRDGDGREENVTGPGVVGEQPKIKPGAHFEYTSFCPLNTPTGNMRGRYYMRKPSGAGFYIKIPVFFLKEESLFH